MATAIGTLLTSKGTVNHGDRLPEGLPADEVSALKKAGVVSDVKPSAKEDEKK